MLDCHWKKEFGIECLTCGFQRSVELLFSGDIVGSFFMFPATIPFLLTILVAILYIWKRFKNGHHWVVSMFSLTALLVVVNYSVKIANGSFMH
ncbi:MAG: DUF2752 domain-containing protein [Fluviicola sp.]